MVTQIYSPLFGKEGWRERLRPLDLTFSNTEASIAPGMTWHAVNVL